MAKILIFLTALLSFSIASAQFSWGVNTGIQYSNVHTNDRLPGTTKYSYLVPGFYFRYKLDERSAVSVGIQFSNKGYKQNVIISSGQITHIRYCLPYLTFPFLYHYELSQGVSLFAGVEPGIKFITSGIADGERQTDEALLTRGFDVGLTGGISFPISTDYSIMLRYTHGLNNVFGKDVSNNGDRLTNRALQLSLMTTMRMSKDEAKTLTKFGFRQGISFSDVYGSGMELIAGKRGPSKRRIAYDAGVEVRFDIKKYFFASTGLSFMQKGGTIENNDPVKISSLMIPLIIGVSPIKTNALTLSIEGGIGISKHMKIINPYYDEGSEDESQSDFMGSFIYGFELSTPATEKLSLFLSYRNIWDSGDFYEFGAYTPYQISTRTFSLNVGLRMKSNRQKKERDEADHNDSDIGIKGGMNIFNTVYKDQPASSDVSRVLKPGLHLGMFFKMRLGEKTSLISELQYTSNLYSAIENPILFSCLLNRTVSLEAGFHWGFALSNYHRSIGSYDESRGNLVDLGLTGGIKYQLSDKIALGGRYFHATNDTFEWYDQGGLRQPTEGFGRNFFVSVYYSF